jgi:polyisoprenoid-binding protein YceI
MIKFSQNSLIKKITLAMVFVMMYSTELIAQNYKLDPSNSNLTVFGTSNVHDWEIKAESQQGNLVLNSDNDIKSLQISIEAEGLKSGKSGMDKNTYKALNTKSYKTIEFKYTKTTSIDKKDDNSYKLTIQGDLKVNGVTKNISMTIDVQVTNNNVSFTGKKTIKMTEFEVEPPTALLGTIKTGDEVTISFNSKFNK